MEFRLYQVQFQPLGIPLAVLTLNMQRQGTELAESLPTTRGAADERVQKTLVHPVHQLFEIDTLGANLDVEVDLHIECRIPESAQALYELGGIWEFGTVAGLEVVNEAATLAEWKATSPAWDGCRGVFGHVLFGVSSTVVVN